MKGMGATIFDTIANIAGRTSSVADTAQQFAQSAPKIEAKAEEAVDIAETWAIASVALQAVAAFSALGMFLIHNKLYNQRHHRSTSSNPRRRKKRRTR